MNGHERTGETKCETRGSDERSLLEDQEEWVDEPLSLVAPARKPVNPPGFLS